MPSVDLGGVGMGEGLLRPEVLTQLISTVIAGVAPIARAAFRGSRGLVLGPLAVAMMRLVLLRGQSLGRWCIHYPGGLLVEALREGLLGVLGRNRPCPRVTSQCPLETTCCRLLVRISCGGSMLICFPCSIVRWRGRTKISLMIGKSRSLRSVIGQIGCLDT